MEASKLSISPERLRFEKMSMKQRTALRRKNIIELIKSTPLDTPIKGAQFSAVTGSSPASCNAMIETLVKKGIVVKEHISLHKIAYKVNDTPVKITQEAREVPKVVAATNETVATEKAQVSATNTKFNLVEHAQAFAWSHNSDSLRDFIAYMDSKELRLYRQMQELEKE